MGRERAGAAASLQREQRLDPGVGASDDAGRQATGRPVGSGAADPSVPADTVKRARLQAVRQAGMGGQSALHHGPALEPARSGTGAVRGWEEPDPGARAHAADAADGPGLCRGHHPGRRPARHHDTVRRAGCRQRGQSSWARWRSRLGRRFSGGSLHRLQDRRQGRRAAAGGQPPSFCSSAMASPAW